MNYHIHPIETTSPPRVVLERSLSLQDRVPTISKGIALVLVVVGISIFALDPLQNLQVPAFFSLGTSFFCLAFGQWLASSQHMPFRFVFDNQDALLKIDSHQYKTSNSLEAMLSYAEIRDFQVRRISERKGDKRDIHYVVEMIKKDGAFWCLFHTPNREEADDVCSQLNKYVQYHQKKSLKTPDSAHSAGKLTLEEGENKTLIHWKEISALRNGSSVLFVCIGLAFCIHPFHAQLSATGNSIIISSIGLFSLLGFAQIFFYFLRSHTLEITENDLRYIPFTELENDDDIGTSFVIRNTDIDTILFNFSLDQKEPTLYVLRQGETGKLLKLKRGQDGPVRVQRISRVIRSIHKIDAHDLNFAEQLHLENALQDCIEKHSGHRVA